MDGDDRENPGVDVAEFLDFYLLDSREQIDRLGTGLLRLEKEGQDINLVNDLFRSAHSLKGASGTMGFLPIVALTHAAEDLLDRLRQGAMEVTPGVVDVLLEVTDRIRTMLAQVEQRQEIREEYEDLVGVMKGWARGGSPSVREETGAGGVRNSPAGVHGAADKSRSSPSEPEGGREGGKVRADSTGAVEAREDNFVPRDFFLEAGDRDKVKEAQNKGYGIYQIDVTLADDTLMKAVRAVVIMQRLEGIGTVLKILPGIEEMDTAQDNHFCLLLISPEPSEAIREEILGVSEVAAAELHSYPTPSVLTGGADVSQEHGAESHYLYNNTPVSAPNAGVPAENVPIHTIRVDTARMDNLINMVGEMVITRTRLVQTGTDLKGCYPQEPLVSSLIETNVYLGRLMNDLQESVMRLRMVPIGTVFGRFPRLVRDLARRTKKEIELVVQGEDTELDKTVVEAIGDPLMHLIRNAVDHGIESPAERRAAGKRATGTVSLDAYHQGNHIAIVVADDGCGLPLEKIRRKAVAEGWVSAREGLSEREIAQFIFRPGFSTADTVTDISGRGVGMDVVKKALNSLGGTVDIDTRGGQGTTFTIRLPLTLAIIQALLVEVGQEVYAIPLSSVLETLLVARGDMKTVGGRAMVQLRGNALPLIFLEEEFDIPKTEKPPEEVFVVVVGLGDKALGLVVDGLRGQQEIVIKSLGEVLGSLPGIAGATILGDGKVTLILDIGSLLQDVVVRR
ncbi:Two component system, signal transduction histidine kinase [Acididesulfobacillus acetoxydans]|uniref:Chemotaxis protein CheA n=1 Tax=Acididesulfobacillus acetoxydans TaxID=1561005 RepID=A0A8S0VYF8_9FIRM|nr:chemotaxis protein CheA [Acididesulfobacillus acetoxydans]CAA7602973.1 Two component system, signal transduction histidine kinase [Acididesulfobacillus acetoxydans]CEJ05855.1 Chemotaxis protein CheA [Acididesulfobacillus acetoxydans]